MRPELRRWLFRTISQIAVAYPDSPLSQGRAGDVVGGQRLPWAAGRYEALRPAGWRLLHVGPVPPAVAAWAQARQLAVAAIAPTTGQAAGTGLYLVRPDGYLGLVATGFDETRFSAYIRQWRPAE